MRRALLLTVALAAPALAAAQSTGEVQFVEPGTTNDTTHGQWINATKCANQATTNVVMQWKGSVAMPSGGTYQIYAANQDMAASGIECPKQPNTSTSLVANPVGIPITGALQTVTNHTETVQAILTAVQQTSCAITSEVIIYICVQERDSSGASVGFAKGQLKFSIAKPAEPPSVSAEPIETGKLRVKWTIPAGDPQAYDYIVTAHSVAAPTPPAPPDPNVRDPNDAKDYRIGPTDPRATQATLGGLTDGIMYAVYVIARSEAANEGPPGGPGYGTPQPVADFWDQYRATPGAVEQGGCATAGAGPLALAGIAALVAARRRRS